MKRTNKLIALVMTAVMAFSISGGVSAAEFGTATIDTGRSTSLTLYKYDLTGAEQDGLWDAQSYVSTGLADETVNTTLSQYALEGMEFSYRKLADLSIYKATGAEGREVLELVESRNKVASTICCSQYDTSEWHENLYKPTLGDAICNRISTTPIPFRSRASP